MILMSRILRRIVSSDCTWLAERYTLNEFLFCCGCYHVLMVHCRNAACRLHSADIFIATVVAARSFLL